jgi:hypothetical protein
LVCNIRAEHRLRVFENTELSRIFGSKRDEVTGEWRKLHSGELHHLYLGENGRGRVQWIHLAVDRDRWPALVSAVMNL